MSDPKYIMAIDEGTTGNTVLIIDVTNPMEANVIGRNTSDFQQHFPKTSWVEHDLNQIWQAVCSSAEMAINQASINHKNFDRNKIVSIGITNQRETICFFDRKTSEPLCNAIVWQDKRSTDICRKLKSKGYEDHIRKKTGLFLDPYFSGSKISWVMQSNPDVANLVKDGSGIIGTIDTWLVHKLTGGESFVTESSNASRTMLLDINTGKWDQELCELFHVPRMDALPEVKQSVDHFGVTKGLSFIPDGIPITGILGDQQAALFGQTCFQVGEAKCTYGTGAFLLVNKGDKVELSNHGLLTTVAWSLNGKITYAFEGSSFIAGAAIQFLRDQFGFLVHAKNSEQMSEPITAAPEIYFVPSLSGLGAPYWQPEVKGAFLGLTRGTTKDQMVRAALEGIAFQVNDLVQSLQNDLGSKISVLNVDGGAVANNILMQCQADFSQMQVNRPANLETTAFGAAMAAAMGVGIYESLDAIKKAVKIDRIFTPKEDVDMVKKQLEYWEKAIRAVQVFAK